MGKLVFLVCLFFATGTYADNGLITAPSAHDVKTTVDRLESLLRGKGMTIFVRINHTEGAKKVGKTLRPTELLIFGNPKVGTPLMNCKQSVAIDLPQKALVSEDNKGQVWITYNDPNYLATRHGIKECGDVIKKIEHALRSVTQGAAKP